MRARRRACLALIAAFLLGALPLPAQTAAADKCRIEGTVVNAVTGQPVRKARVTLLPDRGGEPVVVPSDSTGKFAVTGQEYRAYTQQLCDAVRGQLGNRVDLTEE
jgi:hypothetical protein